MTPDPRARDAGQRLACVLLNYRNESDTLACLRSLQGPETGSLKVFLVNNHADDGSGPRLEEFLKASGFSHRYIEPGPCR